MVDVGTKLRKAYFAALNGNITYEGSPIPIVDEKLDVNITEHDVYVLMQDQNEIDRSNKSYFACECDIVMRVVNQRKATNTKEVVEDVSGQILNTLFPDVNTVALSPEAPLKITWSRKTEALYQPIQSTPDGFVISKTLTIKNRITQ